MARQLVILNQLMSAENLFIVVKSKHCLLVLRVSIGG